jgi:hypothetical protein
MVALRLGLGVLWSLNLIYIFDPANQFWAGFASTAGSYAGSSLGGGGLAQFVAVHPSVFAALIAGVTVYLAAAFLSGLTTRWACVIGGAFNVALLVTQFAQVSTFPGATDVGAQPVYLAMYVALFLGYDRSRLTLDRVIDAAVAHRRAKLARFHPGSGFGAKRPTPRPGAAGTFDTR